MLQVSYHPKWMIRIQNQPQEFSLWSFAHFWSNLSKSSCIHMIIHLFLTANHHPTGHRWNTDPFKYSYQQQLCHNVTTVIHSRQPMSMMDTLSESFKLISEIILIFLRWRFAPFAWMDKTVQTNIITIFKGYAFNEYL